MSLLRPAFTAAIFTSAFLLFWVQPLFGKMLLPMLGGSPSVWLTAMVFYQAVLLGGYLYAHLLGHLRSRAAQVTIHASLLLGGLAFMPLGLPVGWQPSPEGIPAADMLWVMATSIGWPLLVLSASSPLLQAWFAGSSRTDPYPLYAASNAGSMLSLLLFPVCFEVLLPVATQATAWAVGFVLLMGLFGVCMRFFVTAARGVIAVNQTAMDSDSMAVVTHRDRLRWVLYAFVPSSLLMSVTQYTTTDIGAVAFLWILPLALYLLTFMLAFAEQSRVPLRPVYAAHVLLAVPLVASMTAWFMLPGKQIILLHMAWFFVTTLLCHARLFALRPAASHLTGFYLWVSFGGLLGGLFNAIVAPMAFPAVWEYPLMVVLALALVSGMSREVFTASDRWVTWTGLCFLVSILVYALCYVQPDMGWMAAHLQTFRPYLVLVSALLLSIMAGYGVRRAYPLPLFSAMMVLIILPGPLLTTLVARDRSFFGAYTIEVEHHVEDGVSQTFHVFKHGTTLHGAQRVDEGRTTPRTYYHPDGPFGVVLESVRQQRRSPLTVGVVGLGAGAMACNARAGDVFRFFEIDPLVIRVAQDSRYFTYLADCTPEAAIIPGDARLTVQREQDGLYDVLFLDAFSSDAIPVHLLTREALAIWRAKLKPDGMLFYHISNRHLDLAPVLAALANQEGLTVLASDKERWYREMDSSNALDHAVVSALVMSAAMPDNLRQDPRWQVPDAGGVRAWTDDFSNLVMSLHW
jgi:spermidine synthase